MERSADITTMLSGVIVQFTGVGDMPMDSTLSLLVCLEVAERGVQGIALKVEKTITQTQTHWRLSEKSKSAAREFVEYGPLTRDMDGTPTLRNISDTDSTRPLSEPDIGTAKW
jgi:hypothetical protein